MQYLLLSKENVNHEICHVKHQKCTVTGVTIKINSITYFTKCKRSFVVLYHILLLNIKHINQHIILQQFSIPHYFSLNSFEYIYFQNKAINIQTHYNSQVLNCFLERQAWIKDLIAKITLSSLSVTPLQGSLKCIHIFQCSLSCRLLNELC